MRKALIGLVALCAASSANAALIISFVQGNAPLPVGFTVIQDFEGFAPGAALPNSANAFVFANTVQDQAARPAFNSTGNFGAVLGLPNAGFYEVAFAARNAFSYELGSLDTFNVLTLRYADGTSQVLNGAQIALGATADGNQVLPQSNGRVTYFVNGNTPLIIGARFASTSNSFEFDDLATANIVPEPSTWAMMVLGFGIVGRALRRRRRMAVASFA